MCELFCHVYDMNLQIIGRKGSNFSRFIIFFLGTFEVQQEIDPENAVNTISATDSLIWIL